MDYVDQVKPKNLNIMRFVPKRKIDRLVNDPNNDLMFRPVEESVVDQNIKELQPGSDWVHESDAGVTAHSTTGPVSGTASEASGLSVDNTQKAEEELKKKAIQGEGIHYIKNYKIFLDFDHGYARRKYKNDPKDCHIQFDGNQGDETLSVHYFICPGEGEQLFKDTINALKSLSWQFTKITLIAAEIDPNKLGEGKTIEDLFNLYKSYGFMPSNILDPNEFILELAPELKEKKRKTGGSKTKTKKRRRQKKTKRRTKRRRQTKKRGKR